MIFNFLGKIIKPLFKIVDKAVADKDLAQKIKADIQTQLLEGQSREMESAMKIIVAEARGNSWLQRTWRPITMLFFLGLLGFYWFGYAPDYLINNPAVVQKVFSLLQIGIGGYIGGRSVEKIAPSVLAMLEKKKD